MEENTKLCPTLLVGNALSGGVLRIDLSPGGLAKCLGEEKCGQWLVCNPQPCNSVKEVKKSGRPKKADSKPA